MKTIGIDGRFYGEAGPGRYVKNIIESLEKVDTKNKYIVFLRPKGMELYVPSNPNFSKKLADYKWYSWGEQLGFLIKIITSKLDLLYVPHFNFPVLYFGQLVTAIPDLIMHTFSTEKGTTLPKSYFRFKKFIYTIVVSLAVRRSYKVIVPSFDVRNDFEKAFPKTPVDKYVVAVEGVDPVFLDQTVDETQVNLHPEEPYLLYISSMYEHKNVPRLVQAFKIIKENYPSSLKLYLIGKKDKYSLAVEELVKSMGLQKDILLPGNTKPVTDIETKYFRKHALLYVFPSLKEGFSLTPIEAQSFELPCIISDIPVHREIYQDTVAYFNPENVEDMAVKILSLLNNEEQRAELIEKGKYHYKKFNWINTAEITKNVFEAALAKK